MMKPAGEKLEEVLKKVSVKDPDIPYVTNVTAEVVKSGEAIKELLVRQVSSSVRWEQSMRAMIAQGIDTFVEIGPGKTLSGFMKKQIKCKYVPDQYLGRSGNCMRGTAEAVIGRISEGNRTSGGDM